MDQIRRERFVFTLEGVESCCGLKERAPFWKFWSEGDRDYSLEIRSNRAGRFLFCVVRDVKNKRFTLAFPEGRGLVGGWKLLASKLRSLGVSPLQGNGALLENLMPSQASPCRFEEKKCQLDKDMATLRDRSTPYDVVWLEIEKEVLDRNEELLGRCLVGNWEGDTGRLLDLVFFGLWAKNSWLLEGNLWLSNMGGNLWFLEFDFADEAERVSKSGVRRFRGRSFCLERWNPSVGCLEGGRGGARLVWVRILGLPLHLWGRNLFKRFGDSCGRFMVVDENTAERRNLQWAKVLVETREWQHPSSL